MSIKSFLSKKTDTLGYGIACIIISAFISLIVSLITINNGTSKELRAALFKDEIPLLNRVSSIWQECSLYKVIVIGEHYRMEIQPIMYVDTNGDIVKRDTVINEKVIRDTSAVYIPSFAYNADSYAVLQENLEYIRNNIDKLSPMTYASIVGLLAYIDKYPITLEVDKKGMLNSAWTKQEVYSGFFNLIGEIYVAFLRRQKEYL